MKISPLVLGSDLPELLDELFLSDVLRQARDINLLLVAPLLPGAHCASTGAAPANLQTSRLCLLSHPPRWAKIRIAPLPSDLRSEKLCPFRVVNVWPVKFRCR